MATNKPSAQNKAAAKLRPQTFKPGVSANPGGRPKVLQEITVLCREHAHEAVAALLRGLNDPKHYPICAKELLDRGFGKPKITIDGHLELGEGLLNVIEAARKRAKT